MEDILEYDKIVYKIALKYRKICELEDLIQVGRMGLSKAYKNFNSNYNNKFSTYAYKCIQGEILNYIRSSKILKISRDIQSLYSSILKARELLTNKIGREPSNYEISLFLEVEENLVNEAIIANEYVKSLDFTLNDESEKDINLYDVSGYEEKSLSPEMLDLKNEINNLPLEEQKIIYYRYYQDLSQKEVAAIINKNQVSVSRSETKILKKLQNKLI